MMESIPDRYPKRFLSPSELAADPRPRVGVSLLAAGLEVDLFASAAFVAVHSLLTSDALEVAACRLVVLDNGSRGGASFLGLLEEAGATVLRSETNLGIAGGRNLIAQAILREPVDYLIEVHTDHVFPEFWLAPLLSALDGVPRLGAVGPALVTAPGVFGSPALPVDYRRPASLILDDVEGACVLARGVYAGARPRLRRGLTHPVVKRRAALEEVGLYDEAFAGQNFEDTDEVRRLEAAGWQVAVCLDAWAYHHYHLSRTRVGDHVWRFHENARTFRARWPDSDEWLREWERANRAVYAL